jgi:signal peptidase I
MAAIAAFFLLARPAFGKSALLGALVLVAIAGAFLLGMIAVPAVEVTPGSMNRKH